jgi:hypothetical protein
VKPAGTIETTILPGGTAGLAFDGANLTGTPAAVGSFTVTVTAVDAVGASASASLALSIADQPIGFAPTLPAGRVGVPYYYSATLSSTGFGPFTYSATGLPSGLALAGSTIGGTPTKAGTHTATLTATDAAHAVSTARVTMTIYPRSCFTGADQHPGSELTRQRLRSRAAQAEVAFISARSRASPPE